MMYRNFGGSIIFWGAENFKSRESVSVKSSWRVRFTSSVQTWVQNWKFKKFEVHYWQKIAKYFASFTNKIRSSSLVFERLSSFFGRFVGSKISFKMWSKVQKVQEEFLGSFQHYFWIYELPKDFSIFWTEFEALWTITLIEKLHCLRLISLWEIDCRWCALSPQSSEFGKRHWLLLIGGPT